jgi:hypothetical protein
MEKQKLTISSMGKKGWYRLLKVFFIGFFVLVGAGVILGQYIGNDVATDKVNRMLSYAVCDKYGLKRVNLSDTTVYLTRTTATVDSLAHSEVLELSKMCGYSDEVTELSLKSNIPLFTLSLVGQRELNISGFIIYTLISLLVVYGIAEFIRRVFYYVVLGEFYPKD